MTAKWGVEGCSCRVGAATDAASDVFHVNQRGDPPPPLYRSRPTRIERVEDDAGRDPEDEQREVVEGP